MMALKSFLIASCLAVLAAAQSAETSAASSVSATVTASQAMPPVATASFNPNDNITTQQRFDWCLGQTNTCPQICDGSAAVNTCDQSTLTYTCTCPNGTAPDCTAYMDTLPFYICLASFQQCMDAHPNDAQGQSVCLNNKDYCGTRNATAERLAHESASQSSGASMTASGSGSSSGSATAASSGASPTSSGNAAPSTYTIASGTFVALFLAAFKLLL